MAAPIFSQVARYAMRKTGAEPILISKNNLLDRRWDDIRLPKDKEQKVLKRLDQSLQKNVLPQLKGLTLRQALRVASEIKADVQVKGRGRVQYTVPGAGVALGPETKNLRIILSE